MKALWRNALAALLVAALPVAAQNPTATINVDRNANRRAINPNIYGLAGATTAQLSDLNAPLNRYGGNNTTRYNWQLNADNRANDWYYQSIAESSSAQNGRIDTLIAEARAAGAQAAITIPIIGWVARLGANRGKLAGFSIAKYGAQTGNDSQWFPDAGNGIWTNGQFVTGNDPNDANVPNSSSFQQQCVQAMVNRWGLASSGGQPYYILDNEHSIWHSTHRDVHPAGAGMEEVRAAMLNYAAAVKAVDPGAKIMGPEEWGWSGYLLSGSDQQYGSLHGWSFMPDRAAHGNMDYLPWLLNELKLDGRHLLDIFTVHYYPQGGEFSNDTSTAMQQRRNRSTRSLWDPNYLDETWIADRVRLIPRLRDWANTYYYAGTPVGITEYNWGAESHINGATAQADILGIFGREGLDFGARWTTPASTTPVYKAIKMYRNYDGNKSAFGDTSVTASGPNPDNVAAFAAERSSDGALTVMVISKYLSGATPVALNLANFTPSGAAQIYQLTSANAINRLPDVNFSGAALSLTVPAQSITLLVLPKSGVVNQPPTAVASATPTSGTAPLAVTFASAGSSDGDGSIAGFAWNFGDGASAAGASPSHTYTTAGNFNAVLTVTDNLGATATASVSIQVNPDPNFLAAPSALAGTGGRGTASLSWTDNSANETGFTVERAPSGSSAFVAVGTVGANVRIFSQTLPKGTYLYRVRAFHATGTSAYSNTVSVRVR